jgi:hypothetical protein
VVPEAGGESLRGQRSEVPIERLDDDRVHAGALEVDELPP